MSEVQVMSMTELSKPWLDFTTSCQTSVKNTMKQRSIVSYIKKYD